MPEFAKPLDHAGRWGGSSSKVCVVRAFKGGLLGGSEDSALWMVAGKLKPTAIYRYFVNAIPPPLSERVGTLTSVVLTPREWNKLAKSAKDLRPKARSNPEATSMDSFAINKGNTSVSKRRTAIAVADKGVPAKRRDESWLAYHDRLSALAADLVSAGVRGTRVNRILAVAGEIARVHKSVRTRKRKGKSKGPGSYPWEECVRQAMRQYAGYADVEDRARRVCGAIRARSQRKYPAYWRARQPGRKIPGPKRGEKWNPEFFGSARDRALVEDYRDMLKVAKKSAKTSSEKLWLDDQLEWTRSQLRVLGTRKNRKTKKRPASKKKTKKSEPRKSAGALSREIGRL